MTEVIGILAAGASSRMRGRDKLLEHVDGEPLLARQVRLAQTSGRPVFVALPPSETRRRSIVLSEGASPIDVVAEPAGMGDSIAAVAAAAAEMDADALLILLADMPEIVAEDIDALLSAAGDDRIVRAASADGRPGHPVVFPRTCFPDLRRLTGDRGARDIIAGSRDVLLLPLDGERALVDLDTPEAWSAWRAARRG